MGVDYSLLFKNTDNKLDNTHSVVLNIYPVV